MTISIDISPYVTEVTATPEVTTVNLSTQVTTVTASLAFPSVLGLQISGQNVSVAPYNSITATTLQEAIDRSEEIKATAIDPYRVVILDQDMRLVHEWNKNKSL